MAADEGIRVQQLPAHVLLREVFVEADSDPRLRERVHLLPIRDRPHRDEVVVRPV